MKRDNHALTYDCSVLDSLRFESKLPNKAVLLIANFELRKKKILLLDCHSVSIFVGNEASLSF